MPDFYLELNAKTIELKSFRHLSMHIYLKLSKERKLNISVFLHLNVSCTGKYKYTSYDPLKMFFFSGVTLPPVGGRGTRIFHCSFPLIISLIIKMEWFGKT